MFLAKYAVARHFYLPLIKRGVVDFAVGSDWSPNTAGTADVRISKDGGASANMTNTPAAIVMGNTAVWDFSLTAAELTAGIIVVTVGDALTKAVEDQAFVIETYGNASAKHPFDLGTATQSVNVAAGGIASSSFVAGAINAAATSADFLTEITSALYTPRGYVGTISARSNTTVTLNGATASSTNGAYNNFIAVILTDNGRGMTNVVSTGTPYDGTTKVVTFLHSWATLPSVGGYIAIYPVS